MNKIFSRDIIIHIPGSQTDYTSFSAKRIKQQSSRASARVEEAARRRRTRFLSRFPFELARLCQRAPTVPSCTPPTPAVCTLHSALWSFSSSRPASPLPSPTPPPLLQLNNRSEGNAFFFLPLAKLVGQHLMLAKFGRGRGRDREGGLQIS